MLALTASRRQHMNAGARLRTVERGQTVRPTLSYRAPCVGCSRTERTQTVIARAAVATLADAEIKPAFVEGQINEFPTQSGLPPPQGVYAVYDSEETLRYIGVSRNISMTVQSHSKVMGDAVSAIRASTVENATKDDLIEAWKTWLQEAVDATGKVPPGNAEEKEKWQPRRKPAAKAELKLTPGKGVEDLTCSISDLIEAVVKSEKVVAFIKGTRTQPQCGFSYQMLTTLNGLSTEYQVVNVLDELYNPGLREAIKEYSAWPTIPQLYVNGEFVGGSDIVQEMAGNGELASVLNGSD